MQPCQSMITNPAKGLLHLSVSCQHAQIAAGSASWGGQHLQDIVMCEQVYCLYLLSGLPLHCSAWHLAIAQIDPHARRGLCFNYASPADGAGAPAARSCSVAQFCSTQQRHSATAVHWYWRRPWAAWRWWLFSQPWASDGAPNPGRGTGSIRVLWTAGPFAAHSCLDEFLCSTKEPTIPIVRVTCSILE